MAIMTREQVFPTNNTGNGNTGNSGTGNGKTGNDYYNPSGDQPAVTNSSTVDNTVGGYANSGVSAYGDEHKKADDYAKGLYDEQLKTDPTSLNKNQNAIYSEDGGQYGRANRRSYETTLQLSREADAYNNKPTEQVLHWTPGASGQIMGGGSLVDPYNRPKIETEEMREMQKSRQLDLNQKQLAQALQDAVNHKDYNAFIQLFQQRYNMNLTRYQADLAMRTFQYQQLAEQVLFKDRTIFNICAELWGIGLKAQKIWQIAQSDPGLAWVYMTLLAGKPIILDEDISVATRARDLIRSGVDPAKALPMARAEYNRTIGASVLNETENTYNEERGRK